MTQNNNEAAESLAIQILVWLSQDEKLMQRFLSLSGIEASSIRQAATEPGFLAGVIQFLLNHEPTLLSFCEENNVNPAELQKANISLSGQQPIWE